MSHKIHPIGFRLGITKKWLSNWFVDKAKKYKEFVMEDIKIREFLSKSFKDAEVVDIKINRTANQIDAEVRVVKAGVAIGRQGKLIESVKQKLSKMLKGKNVSLKIVALRKQELSAKVLAERIALGIVRRRSVKSLVKKTIEQLKKAGVEGAKIQVSGRIGGGIHSNVYTKKFGRIAMQTLRADIDYAYVRAETPNAGVLSVKVWLYNKTVYL